MKTFPAAYTIEKNKKVGAKPLWILRLSPDSGDIYLAGKSVVIPSFAGSTPWPASTVVTTTAAITNCGTISSGISSYLGAFSVSDVSVNAHVGGNTLSTLALADDLDLVSCELYKWYIGCTDPPQLIYSGKIRDIPTLDDTSIQMQIQDNTVDLDRFYIGTKVDLTTYANADVADVGKVIPIPFGTVTKVPAVCLDACIQTSLSDDATISDTTIYLSDVTAITAGKIFLIESEKVYITGIGTDYVTVTRAYSGTTAATHSKGVLVIELKTSIFCCSDRAITTLDKVWIRNNGLDIDISTLCNKYNGVVQTPDGLCSSAQICIGSTPQNIGWGHFYYDISGLLYHKNDSAVGGSIGAGSVPSGTYGAVAVDIGANGTVDFQLATNITASDPDGILTAPSLSMAPSPNNINLKTSEFSYRASNVEYTCSAATYNMGYLGLVSIPQNKYGAVAAGVNPPGLGVGFWGADDNATGYDSAAAALAGLTTPAGWIQAATVVIIKTSAGAFVFGTTAFNASGVTATFADSTLLTFTPGDGYASSALAIAGLPSVASSHVRMGWVTATKSDGVFTFGTTSFEAVNVTTSIVNNPADYSANPPVVGASLAGYDNKSVIEITSTNLQSIAVMVQQSLQNQLDVSQGSHAHTIAASANPTVQFDTIPLVSGALNPWEYYPDPPTNIIDGDPDTYNEALGGSGAWADFTRIGAVTEGGTPTSYRIVVVTGTNGGYQSPAQYLYYNATLVETFYLPSTGGTCYTNWHTISAWSDLLNVKIELFSSGWPQKIYEAYMECTISEVTDPSPATGVNLTGDIILTGAFVSSLFGSGKILADMTADLGTRDEICTWLLAQASKPSITSYGTFSITDMAGIINEYHTALWWLNKIAFESCAWVTYIDAPKLISRAGSGSSKTIPACAIDGSGKRIYSLSKASFDDLVNKIILLYDRDWTQSESDKSYNKTVTVSSGAADRERPELFRFYFVRDDTDAAAIAAEWLALIDHQPWISQFTVYLDHSEVEIGDTAVLSFSAQSGIITNVSHAPGSYRQIHAIKLSVRLA